MWQYVVEVGLWAGLEVLNYLLKPDQKVPQAKTDKDLKLPQTEEGTPVPMVFGRARVESPILVWTSELQHSATEYSAGTVTFCYGVDMLFVAGTPMGQNQIQQGGRGNFKTPRLYNVWIGDTKLTAPKYGYVPIQLATSIVSAQEVVMPTLFGGPGAGYGIVGTYEFFGGYIDQDLGATTPGFTKIGDQIANDHVSFPAPLPSIYRTDPTLFPGFRNQMLVAFTNIFGDTATFADHQAEDVTVDNPNQRPSCWTIGENPNVDGFSFEIGSYGDHLFSMVLPGLDFGGDADPSEVIYDVLTNTWSKLGLGLDQSKIDVTSFQAASATLKAESHGYSRVVTGSDTGVSVIGDVLAQVDAALYEEPTTGKMTLKLVRADYSIPALPLFDESNIVGDSFTDYGIGGWRESFNEVRIAFTDRAHDYKTGTAVAQSLSNAVNNDLRRRSQRIAYVGCTNGELAGRLARRDLNALSRPLRKVSFAIDRDGYILRPAMVFRLSWKEYNLDQAVFRVTRVDLGQRFDNKVIVDAVEDIFDVDEAAFTIVTWDPSLLDRKPLPITERVFIEAPRFLQYLGVSYGAITTENFEHVLALASRDDDAISWSEPTSDRTGFFNRPYQPDVPSNTFPMRGRVALAYPKELEPYDTTTGLRIGSIVDVPFEFRFMSGWAPSTIASDAGGLLLIGNELIAYETVTDNLDGTYTLGNVWRALMDTVPQDHAVGDRVWFVDTRFVGVRNWIQSRTLVGAPTPRRKNFGGAIVDGSGGDPTDTIITRRRHALPLRVANLTAEGEVVTGITGVPAVAGRLKSISSFEEALSLRASLRDRNTNTVIRGDASDETHTESGFSYLVTAQKVGQQVVTIATISADTPFTGGQNYLVGAAGHGTIDIGVVSRRTVQVGDANTWPAGTVMTSQQTPTVRLNAPRWRNLLGNPRWTFTNGSGYGPCWINGANTQYLNTASFTANGQTGVVVASSGAAADTSFVQIVDVSGFIPRGMTAILDYYDIAQSITGTPRVDVTVTPLDVNGAGLSGAQTLTSSPSTTTCQRRTTPSVPLPVGTAKIKVDVRLYSNAGYSTPGVQASLDLGTALGEAMPGPRIYAHIAGVVGNSITFTLTAVGYDGVSGNSTATSGSDVTYNVRHSTPEATAQTEILSSLVYATQISTNNLSNDFTGGPFSLTGGVDGVGGSPQSIATEFCLRIGQQLHDLLANGNFDTATTSWTVDVGAFTGGVTTNARPSAGYLQGGAATLSTMWQEYTPPAGWEIGSTAILTLWRMNVLVKDTGTVTIDWRDALGNVLASTTTGAENMPVLNVWYRRRLALDVPLGATKLRVTITAARSLISGNSGSCFDDLVLDVHKNLDPIAATTLAFDTLAIQRMPSTWQAHHLAFPSISFQALVYGGTDFNGFEMQWSDNAIHAPAKLVGAFGAGVTSVDAYALARGGAYIQQVGSQSSYHAYRSSDQWTIVVFFRVEEQTWMGTAGLCGRIDSTAGWALDVDATGHVRARVRGVGGDQSAQRPTTVIDGALHMAAVVSDGSGNLTVYDERGSATSSFAAIGEIFNASATTPFLIGKTDGDVFPGSIARVFAWPGVALSSAQIAAQWTYGNDPTTKVTSTTRTCALYVDGVPDGAGATLAVMAPDQLAIGYSSALVTDGGTGLGLCLVSNHKNLIRSFDFTDASAWTWQVAKVVGVIDPTGQALGASVTATVGGGLVATGIVATSAPNFSVVFWARSASGASLGVELQDTTGSIIGLAVVAVPATNLWTRCVASFTTWSGSTATAVIRWRAAVGTVSFDLAHVVCCVQSSETPTAYAPALTSTVDVTATIAGSITTNMNPEGEIVTVGASSEGSPAIPSAIASIRNTLNAKDRRDLYVGSSEKPTFDHYDASATNVASQATAVDWSQVWTLRARWCAAQTLDATSNAFAGIVAAGSVSSSAYGRTATWTYDATAAMEFDLGIAQGSPLNAWIRSATFQSRESKLT